MSLCSSPAQATFPTTGSSFTWREALAHTRGEAYFKEIIAFVESERARGAVIYPKNADMFNALAYTPLDEVKVVIIGQDPYHGPDQAHGLCFSVRPGVQIPPSLVNIYREIKDDLGIDPPGHGCLQGWAEQGVLLLNSVLSVERGKAGSHSKIGWERFTDEVIQVVNRERESVVFLLWGSYAQAKGQSIDTKRHLILKAPHPSPLSAHRGFFGCRHFSKANAFLQSHSQSPIDWAL